MEKMILKLSVLLIITCTVFGVNNISAQEKTTFQLLQGKTWVLQFPPEEKNNSVEWRFSVTESIYSTIVSGNHFEQKSPYYLSDSRTNAFDKQKVGNVQKGKYIIINSIEQNNNMRVLTFEIIELTNTDLKLKSSNGVAILTFKSNNSIAT